MSNGFPPPLIRASEEILSETQVDLQRVLARALTASTEVDRNGSLYPAYFPEDIRTLFGISFDAMRDYGILIGKDAALEVIDYLNRNSGRNIAVSKKGLSAEAYRNEFRRDAAKVGNALMFTYSAMVSWFGYSYEMNVPKKIRELSS